MGHTFLDKSTNYITPSTIKLMSMVTTQQLSNKPKLSLRAKSRRPLNYKRTSTSMVVDTPTIVCSGRTWHQKSKVVVNHHRRTLNWHKELLLNTDRSRTCNRSPTLNWPVFKVLDGPSLSRTRKMVDP